MHCGVIHRIRRRFFDFVIGHRVAAMDADEVRIERLSRGKTLEAFFGKTERPAQKTARAARVHNQPRPQLHRAPAPLAAKLRPRAAAQFD
ncbi:MAG: hypothetical protein HONDAALG_04317 [Gammaproteobacteria bacterium]|nr:hypothetical protein [Gammaproteobacteria bacterium]